MKNEKKHTVNSVTFYDSLADTAQAVSAEEWDYYQLADTISDLVAEHMNTHKVTKAELAKRLGTSRSFVSKVLAGDTNMTLKTLSRILHHLEAKPVVKVVSKADEVQWLGVVTSRTRRETVRDWRVMPRSSKATKIISSLGECEKMDVGLTG